MYASIRPAVFVSERGRKEQLADQATGKRHLFVINDEFTLAKFNPNTGTATVHFLVRAISCTQTINLPNSWNGNFLLLVSLYVISSRLASILFITQSSIVLGGGNPVTSSRSLRAIKLSNPVWDSRRSN